MGAYDNRWSYQITSKFDDRVSIEKKHERLMEAFARHEFPWGLKGMPSPEAPNVGFSDLSAELSLTRRFKTPVRFANVSYSRRDPPKYSRPDDVVNFDFNKLKVSTAQFKTLVLEVLPDYVESFGADQLNLSPQRPYIDYVWESGRRECYGPTTIRGRVIACIAPVNFWSALACVKGFGKTPQQIAEILKREDVPFSFLRDGIYVVFSDEIIGDEHALDYEHQFRQLLEFGTVEE